MTMRGLPSGVACGSLQAQRLRKLPHEACTLYRRLHAGGGVDFVARLIAPKLTERRAAGSSRTAPRLVDDRLRVRGALRTDGYTLTLITPSFSSNPSLHTVSTTPRRTTRRSS